MNESTRAWIYRIAVAVLAILVVYGVISDEEVGVWVALVAAVLGLGGNALAAANTSTKSAPDD